MERPGRSAPFIILGFTLFAALMLCAVSAFAEGMSQQRLVISRGGQTVKTFTVEVISDRSDRERGLSGRPSLTPNAGMLFVMERDVPSFFWMKGMRFPLDLLFFDKDRRLISVLPGLQPCENDCVIYQPPPAAAYALEVNAGTAAANGLTTGDRFDIKQ